MERTNFAAVMYSQQEFITISLIDSLYAPIGAVELDNVEMHALEYEDTCKIYIATVLGYLRSKLS